MCMHIHTHYSKDTKKIKSKKKQENCADKISIHSYPPTCPSLGYTTRGTTTQPEIQSLISLQSQECISKLQKPMEIEKRDTIAKYKHSKYCYFTR